jgi:hypothetical protein
VKTKIWWRSLTFYEKEEIVVSWLALIAGLTTLYLLVAAIFGWRSWWWFLIAGGLDWYLCSVTIHCRELGSAERIARDGRP